MNTGKHATALIAAIGLYLMTTGISAWAFGAFGGQPSPPVSPQPVTPGRALVIDPSEPKDQPCPVNGKLFSKTEQLAWSQQRPALVMLENHPDARPQSGLSAADVVYEAVAEGGITRFMGVFYCGAIAAGGKVAPVRSARMYFVNIAAEYNEPIYAHVGGGNCSRDGADGQCTSDKRAWALEELVNLGWRRRGGNDFDTTLDIGYPVLSRDYNRLGPDKTLATEHTMIGSLAAIWEAAKKRGLTGSNDDGTSWVGGFTPWKFKDPAPLETRGTINAISFDFWEGYKDFTVRWEIDTSTDLYQRLTGGQPHLDLENKQQLTASAVIIQFVKEEGPLDGHKHMFYDVVGKGNALVFQDGNVLEGTWEKKDQESRTLFKDNSGKEISFVRGPMWVEVVPAGNEITY